MNAFNLLSSDTIHGVKNGIIVGFTVNFSIVQNCSKTISILVGVIGTSFWMPLVLDLAFLYVKKDFLKNVRTHGFVSVIYCTNLHNFQDSKFMYPYLFFLILY